MKNKETLQTAMDRRLSFLDDLPSCRPALMQRIAQEEEPVMKKRVSLGLVVALIIVSLSVIAVAAGLLLSPRVTASQLAVRELEKTYGVSEEMLSFFQREEEELADGAYRVTFRSGGELGYVLGSYTVEVKDGKASSSWSHDGESTAGGFDAEAWGPEQMKQMMAVSSDAAGIKAYTVRAEAIAAKHGYSEDKPSSAEPSSEDDVPEYRHDRREADKTAALQARKLPEQQMVDIAREFIISNYSLTQEQISRLELFTEINAEEANAWYETVQDKPCFLVEYLLDKDHYSETLSADPNYVRDNSYYKVFVNVETGVIEQYEYYAGVGGIS